VSLQFNGRHFKIENLKNFKMQNSQNLSLNNIVDTIQVCGIFAMAAFFILSQTFG